MIYTITFNPALDYLMFVDNLQTKDINRSRKESIFYGGKGINVSVILKNLGIDNTALGFSAGFTGRELEKMLKEDGIKTDFTHLSSGNTRINVKIRSNEEMDINANGPEITESDINSLYEKLDKTKDGDCIVLAGSIPPSLPENIYENILKHFENKKINFVVDTTGDLLKSVLKFKPFLIKPNHHELGDLFGVDVSSTEDIVYYSKELQKMGARNVLVSRSKDGATLVDENGNVKTIGIIKGQLVNSVGCGDSMVAGFIAGYQKYGSYDEALKWGSASGNATAFSEKLATKEEIIEIYNKINL